MKTLVIYTSQTGFTKRYAEWIAARTQADILTIDEAKKKKEDFFASYNAILYGGWAMAGGIVSGNWFLSKAENWRGKKLAVFCVGATPNGAKEVDEALDKLLTSQQKEYISAFYCQGGLSYENMKLPSKLAMKAFASMVRNKKNPTQQEKQMGEMISHSYDIADEKYIEPIVAFIME